MDDKHTIPVYTISSPHTTRVTPQRSNLQHLIALAKVMEQQQLQSWWVLNTWCRTQDSKEQGGLCSGDAFGAPGHLAQAAHG